MYMRPRVFGGKTNVEARDHVGNQVKLAISWDVSNRYLGVTLIV